MNRADEPIPIGDDPIPTLARIVERNQVWPLMAAKYGVENLVPPWKTSLDGLCDALDHAACDTGVPDFTQRRDEEDLLSATLYADLPYPENQLVSLTHSLVARGLITESELRERLAVVRGRLEA
ncbi:thiocyanate hydrolase [Mycobacterium sp. GA-1841]|uniref:thiocyanate hydrolase n=1 Tax=Mycobacterium sp. GA-1841 TaxID=1834154 RepID=UPI00096F5FD8|nr:thiocyanate hydrolase [Mycobacterium sp. GA-1841]OMC35949.1 thiocyanate hydrolase [Mycobacterium sp. GA-1841]